MMPVLEGKRMIIMLSPLKAAPKKEAKQPKSDVKAEKPQDEKETQGENAEGNE